MRLRPARRRLPDGDIEAALGAPVLGSLLHRTGPGAGAPVLLQTGEDDAVERYLSARAEVLAVASAAGAGTLLVTSTHPGEGKTSVVADLALALARDGRHVAAVDADLRDPGLQDRFHLDEGPGLVDVVERRSDLHQVAPALSADIGTGSLRIVPAGAETETPSELLGRPEVGELLADLRATAELVLVDTPPLTRCLDALVVGRHLDGALVVVAPGTTTAGELRTAARRFDRAGVPVLGALVNEP